MSIEAESLGIPDTDYPTFIKMSSSEFNKLCKETSALAEIVNIEVLENRAKFSFSGKSGSGNIILRPNESEKEEDQVDIEYNENVKNYYGLQYLTSFTKASTLTKKVGLYLSSSFPLMIDYNIENVGFIKFYLAPKMDDDV